MMLNHRYKNSVFVSMCYTLLDELNPKEKQDKTGKTDVETLQAELEKVERPISSVTSGYDSAGSTMICGYVDIDIEDSSGNFRIGDSQCHFMKYFARKHFANYKDPKHNTVGLASTKPFGMHS